MPLQFTKSDFKREKVKQRLVKHAATLWGFNEATMDGFDPLVELLFGACAVEFEKTAQEFQNSHTRIVKKLSQLLLPEVTTSPTPAHTVVHARPVEPTHRLGITSPLSINKEIIHPDQPGKPEDKNLVFSPAAEFSLFDGDVVYMATAHRLLEVVSPLLKQELAQSSHSTALPSRTLWLGIQLPEKQDAIQEITFYVDWITLPEKAQYLASVPYLRWSTGNQPLSSRLGYTAEVASRLTQSDRLLSALHQPATAMSRQVLRTYQPHFVTVDVAGIPRQPFPSVFSEVFDKDLLARLTDPLLWLRLELPESLPLEAAADMICAANCFPVLNQKREGNNRPYRISRNNSIIPLDTEDHFLAIHRVVSNEQKVYTESPLQQLGTLNSHTYTVRQQGVGRFDARNASELLDYLLNLLRDEAAAFEAAGSQRLTQEIKTVKQQIARLETLIAQRQHKGDVTHYLMINTEEDEDVWVDYWSTTGALANQVPAGTRIQIPGNLDLQPASLLTLTTTRGGREKPNDEERLYALQSTLLSRDKLVTEEDIRAACRTYLGTTVRQVTIRKGLTPSAHPQRSFERTIIAHIITDLMLPAEQRTAEHELEQYLQQRASLLFPIQVQITSHSESA